MKRPLSLTICLLIVPTIAHGATYYVAKTGSDAIDCSSARSTSTPVLTIRKGLRCLTAGDTLIIRTGIYPESINARQIPSGLSLAQPTTIKAETPGSVVLRPLRGGTAGDVIWISGQKYLVLDGLVVDAIHVPVQGIRINEKGSVDSTHIRLVDLEVKNASRNNCVGVKGGFIEIRSSKIHHCGATKLHHGIYLRGSNHLVEGSQIYGNHGFGIHQYDRSGKSDNVVLRYNNVYDNGYVGILIGSGYNNMAYDNVVQKNGYLDGRGGIIIGYFNASDNQVYNNRISGNAGQCITILRGSTNAKVFDNTCWQDSHNAVTDNGSGSVVSGNRVIAPLLGTSVP